MLNIDKKFRVYALFEPILHHLRSKSWYYIFYPRVVRPKFSGIKFQIFWFSKQFWWFYMRSKEIFHKIQPASIRFFKTILHLLPSKSRYYTFFLSFSTLGWKIQYQDLLKKRCSIFFKTSLCLLVEFCGKILYYTHVKPIKIAWKSKSLELNSREIWS
jgi:hypothetical protein